MKLIKGPRWISGGRWRRFDWSYQYAGRAGFTALMDIDPSASNCLTSKKRSRPRRANPKLKRGKQSSREDVCSEGLRKLLSKWSGAPRLLTVKGFRLHVKKADCVAFVQVLSTRKFRTKLKVCSLIASQQFDRISAVAVAFPKRTKKRALFIFAQILVDAVTMQQEEESQNWLASVFGCQRLKESWNMRDVAPPWLLVYREQPCSRWLI